MMVIETKNLTKKFGSNIAVNAVSLQVKPGEIFGFLGRNGAGKSTFINMLTGITIPTAGTCRLFGSKSLNEGIHNIGVLPDYSSFYNNLSAKGHLKYFSRLTKKNVSDKRMEEVLELVGLYDHQNKKVSKFSFGMKKKLGIAQAIVHDPNLLFLDEPTSGVDAESVIQIQRLIRTLNREGKTIFMTSHNLDEVEKVCTNIAIMKKGQIFTHGSMVELKQAFQTAYNVRVKLSPDITEKEKTWIEQHISRDTYDYKWENHYFIAEVFTEEDIPLLLQCLVNLGVSVYGVEVIEPSLEEIFMEQGKEVK